MSWCRFGFGGSDLYIFDDVNGGITCCWCPFKGDEPENFNCATATDMYAHILKHHEAGHAVIPSLLEEARESAAGRKTWRETT